MYVFSQTALTVLGLIQPDPKVSDMNYIRGTAGVTPQVRKIGDPPP
jgi:hypothetical protein